MIIPWFTGERTPDIPQAAPVFFGFGLEDFTPEATARPLLEGHVLNLYHGFQRMPVSPHEIRLTGGLSQSESWCQAIADIFEAETVPVRGEGAALGAAIHAAWVWNRENGREISLEELTGRFVTMEESRRKRPDAGTRDVFRDLKRLYSDLVDRLTPSSGKNIFRLRAGLLPPD